MPSRQVVWRRCYPLVGSASAFQVTRRAGLERPSSGTGPVRNRPDVEVLTLVDSLESGVVGWQLSR